MTDPNAFDIRKLGRIGVWSGWLREAERAQRIAACAQIEDMGYGAVWLPGKAGGDDYFGSLELALASTNRIVVAAGIVNIWAHEPQDVIRFCADMQDRYPGRFLLGLGVSHANLMPGRYKSPLESMNAYLDALDGAAATGAGMRCLAALGPKMVQLARERSLGVHSYNVTTRHTREAREALGSGKLIAPEQTIVVEDDPRAARATAREYVGKYRAFENYQNSWRRLGFTEEDLANGGSDRLVDAVVAWGDAGGVAARLSEHLSAGADHVCVQVWTTPADGDPRPALVRLAKALPSLA